MAADNTYEHADMVLAATISMHSLVGIAGAMERRGDQVVWIYKRTEELDALVEEFHNGDCLVEPLVFAKMLRSTRNKVYALMGYNPPRVQPEPSDEATP